MSKHNTSDADRDGGSSWLETIGVVIGALVLALLIQQFLVKPYKIPSESMVPTLVKGQRVLVNRLGNNFGEPKVGDIYVFRPPAGAESGECAVPRAPGTACLKAISGKFAETYVKRLVGGPGDRLQVREGHVIRNGKEVDEPYAVTCSGEICDIAPFTVPKDRYFMMGDNRGDSMDSRYWGPLTRDYFIGRAFATYWPPKRIGGL
jgi:signal peptidase I